MNWLKKRRSPFEGPLSWRRPWRLVRNWLLIAIAIVACIDRVGEPFLRWEYHYQGKQEEGRITDAIYVGWSGRFKAYAGEYAEGCPLILFVPPKPPLWKQILSPASAFAEPSNPLSP